MPYSRHHELKALVYMHNNFGFGPGGIEILDKSRDSILRANMIKRACSGVMNSQWVRGVATESKFGYDGSPVRSWFGFNENFWLGMVWVSLGSSKVKKEFMISKHRGFDDYDL
ncbi:hypothetical protein VNO78_12325 [Psophocarpus tetragonolobus]|uniref:Uncharacterized protein n=1 Tax=Psophocarpus tetragonolobus TaxID=3891 RepID=A0AAN9SMS9_PSOTE